MRKLMKLVENLKNQGELERRLVVLSKKYGGAWVGSRIDFANEVHFHQFQSPSKIPDRYMDSHDPFNDSRIGYNGKLQSFSKAARMREQNRGVGGDR